jgi:hypothetical protein
MSSQQIQLIRVNGQLCALSNQPIASNTRRINGGIMIGDGMPTQDIVIGGVHPPGILISGVHPPGIVIGGGVPMRGFALGGVMIPGVSFR